MPILVDSDRLRADFEALAEIGATPDGGVERTTFSAAHSTARAWFLGRAREAGLEAHVDSAANHSAVLPSLVPGARTLLVGSHLDSVRRGGAYDGALGVVCALEVLRAVNEADLELPVTLEAIDFTDEEGTLIPTLGSRAFAGLLSRDDLAAPRGGRDLLVSELARMDLTEEGLLAARRDPSTLSGYLELHVEQGPILEREGVEVGVVTGITGASSFLIEFEGDARHAGTTPMSERRDAAVGAAAFVTGVRETVIRDYPGCVATVGDIVTEPGAFNVIPGLARLRLECRSLDTGELAALSQALVDLARDAAAALGLDVAVEHVGHSEPTPTDEAVRRGFASAAEALGLTSVELPSGAGHDAQPLATIVPSGLVFVPSVGGISHDPSEYTPWWDCVNGANVLLGAALQLARAAPG